LSLHIVPSIQFCLEEWKIL